MKKLSWLLILVTTISISHAQDEVWYFGYGKTGANWWPEGGNGVSFTGAGAAPVGNNSGALGAYESISVVSDGSGNVLFYSDGAKIYNKNHVVMNNGTGLLGPQEDNNAPISGSSANGVFSTFDPGGDPNKYFIFTINDIENPVRNGFRYNVIDMTANGGLGSVTSKNQIILAGSTRTEEFMAMSGSPCSDTTWVVVHGGGNNSFYAVPLTPNGVEVSNMITTNIGPTVNVSGQGRGTFSFNSDGTKLAMAGRNGLGGWIFDFDPYTGVVSNPLQASNKPGHYGCAWSPDDQNVYFTSGSVGSGTEFVHFNTNLPVSGTNPSTIYNGAEGQGAIELGKDGKLYIGRWDVSESSPGSNVWLPTTSLSVIDNPNAANAAACGWTLNGYDPGNGGTMFLGLPKMFFKSTNVGGTPVVFTNPTKDTTFCDTTSSFQFLTTPASGGTFTSSPNGLIASDGTFDAGAAYTAVGEGNTVQITYDGSCLTPATVTITMISCCPPVAITAPTPTCAENSVDLSALVVSGVGTWTVSPVSAGAISGNITFIPTPKTAGTYTLTYTLNTTSIGCTNEVSTTITVNSPSPAISNDIALLCIGSGTDMILTGTPSGGAWNTGGSNPLALSTGGTYTYLVTDGDGCIDSAAYIVDSDLQPIVSLNDLSICINNGGATLDATTLVGTDTYAWNNAYTNPTLSVTVTGTYWVDVSSGKGCIERGTADVDYFTTTDINITTTGNVICTGAGDIITIAGVPAGGTWSDGGADSHDVSSGNTYTYSIVDANVCSFSESVVIPDETPPAVNLNDITICLNTAQTVSASTGVSGDTYSWEDGTTDPTRTVNSAGKLWIRITSENKCLSTDTMIVKTSTPPTVTLPNDTFVCAKKNESVNIKATFDENDVSKITWNEIGIQGDDEVLVNVTPITLIVTVTNTDNCSDTATMYIAEKCDTFKVFVPNVCTGSLISPCQPAGTISPNDLLDGTFMIYNRWGLMMYETDDLIPSWNGNYNGSAAATGVYFWIWEYEDIFNILHKENGYMHLLKTK